MPALDPVAAPAGFLLLVLACVLPAPAHGREQTVKPRMVVDENKLDRFGNVEVQSKVTDIDPTGLYAQLRASPGGAYGAEAIDKTVETLTIEITKRGHAFVQVHPRIDPDLATHAVNVVFVLEEGPHVRIERMTIRGNNRTREYVIRREFDVAERDAYNKMLIDRAERRLKNLDFFKSVNVTTEPGSAPDHIVVNVILGEVERGSLDTRRYNR